MFLRDLLKNCRGYFCQHEILNTEVKKITFDINKVEEGDLYICLKEDCFSYSNIKKANEKGAAVILSQCNHNIPNEVVVNDIRKAYALISKAQNDNACDNLKIIAVTGTNGKTTTCKIISDFLNMANKKVGIIGTLGAGESGKLKDTGFTTPDPEILHSIFKDMYNRGYEYVIMEASAHALELSKLEGIKFEIAVFTNLTQDHLDFFGTIENYFQAKQKLFSSQYSKMGIVNIDDAYGRKICDTSELPIFKYGFDKELDASAKNIVLKCDGSQFDCNILGTAISIQSQLVGDYNVQNMLGAIMTAKLLGLSEGQIKDYASKISPAEGRFNTMNFNGVNVVIDFAHTPDGLEKVLKTARRVTKGNLFCVFGCGGNRDKTKRAIMGKIAEEICDAVYITSDNPRFEKPMDIINDIKKGMSNSNHKVFEKRDEAIAQALFDCQTGDCVVIAGKGGEKYQEIEGVKYPYDDFEVVQDILDSYNKEEKEKKHAN